MSTYKPEEENLITSTADFDEYYYCNIDGQPVHKSKVLFKNEDRIVFYPYSVSRVDGSINLKRINTIETIGWNSIHKVPKDIKRTGKYGFKSLRLRQFFQFLYPRFPNVNHVVFSNTLETKFYKRKWFLNGKILNQY